MNCRFFPTILAFVAVADEHKVCADDQFPYALTAEELAREKLSAVSGSTEAAVRVWKYYDVDQNNWREGAFWLRLAAEQQACEAQIEYAQFVWWGSKDKLETAKLLSRSLRAECKDRLEPWKDSIRVLERSMEEGDTKQ